MSNLINSGILEDLRAEYELLEETFRPLEAFIEIMDNQRSTIKEIVEAAGNLDIDVSFTLSYPEPKSLSLNQRYAAAAKVRKERMASIEEHPVLFNSSDTTMLTPRLYSLLNGVHIRSLTEVQFIYESYLFCIRGFGEKSFKELEAVMAMEGLKIGSMA